jgi:hypothetical protein
MFDSLPPNGQLWTLDEAADWLHAAAYNLRFANKLKGRITVDIKVESRLGRTKQSPTVMHVRVGRAKDVDELGLGV